MDLCSTSNSSDIDMDSFEKATADIKIQELQMKVETLQGTNIQLQRTIDNLKNQLKEISSRDFMTPMNQKILELQQKLHQESTSKAKFEKQVNILTKQLKSECEEHQLQQKRMFKENSELHEHFERQKSKYEETKSERDNLLLEMQEKDNIIEEMSYQILLLRQKRKKSIKANKMFSKEIQKLQMQLKTETIERQKTQNQNNAYTQEVETLKIELGTIKALRDGNDRSVTSLNEELKKKINTIQILQVNFGEQRKEIEQLINQRDSLIQNLHTLHQSNTKLEYLCSSLEKENEIIQKKLLQATINCTKNSNNDIIQVDDFTLPFNATIKDTCLKMLQNTNYTQQQRIQSVFTEIGKYINQISENSESNQKTMHNIQCEKEIYEEKAKILAEFLNSMNKELKNITISEQQINTSCDCKSDEKFLNFMANKCAEVDPLISDYASHEPSFIPSYFLFSDDPNQRSKIIQKLFEPNDESFSLFTTQFLLNNILRRQLTQALAAVQTNEKASQALNEIGIEKLSDFPSFVKEIGENMQKWKQQKKKLAMALGTAQDIIKQNQQTMKELQNENIQIKNENEKINSEIEVLGMKLQIAENELENAQKTVKQRECQMQESLEADDEINTKIKETEDSLREKENEVRNLEESYSLLEKRFKSEVESYARKIMKMEKNNTLIVEEFRKTNEEKDLLYNKRKAKFRKDIKELRNSYEKQIEELKHSYDTAKTQFDSIVTEMKEKSAASSDLYKKIINQLKESEKLNAALRAENAALSDRAKAAEAERIQSSENNAKSQRQAQAQIAAQQLAIDSKAQERVMAIKAEAEASKQRLFDIVSGSIGDLYGVSSEMLDENSLHMLLSQARKDIGKLKVFQNSASLFE